MVPCKQMVVEEIKMKVLLFGIGKNSMLGGDILRTFDTSKYEFFLTDLLPFQDSKEKFGNNVWFEKADVRSFVEVRELFNVKPDIVINASAYTDVDGCEDVPDLAYAVNATGVENIAKSCAEFNIPLVHVSTDYVFDGTKQTPYTENDKVNPLGIYGKSKLEGENLLKATLKKYYITRTALLYGKNRTNFVTKIVEKARNNEVITVPDDMFGSPTWTTELAKQIEKIIEAKPEFGTYHTVNIGSCSRYEWAKKIVEFSGLKAEIKAIKSNTISSKAKRPLFSALENHALKELGLNVMNTWEKALENFIRNEMKNG